MDDQLLGPQSDDLVSRRRILGLLGAGAAGTAAALLTADRAQAGHDSSNVLHLGEVNFPPLSSGLGGRSHISINIDDFALSMSNEDLGDAAGGIYVTSQGGKPGIEVDVLDGDGVAVQGVAGCCEGFGQGAATGVQGITGTGVGVHAIANSLDGVALRVEGRAAFSSAGAGTIPQNSNSVFVANSAVTDQSHITVTLTSNPGPRVLRAVSRQPGVGFTVYLTTETPRPATQFSYLIIEIG